MQDSSASWRGCVAFSEADARPGAYYVTCQNDHGKTAYLLGPFIQPKPGQNAHAQALGRMRSAKRYISKNYPNSTFWTFGTCRVAKFSGLPIGKLNEVLS